MKPRIIEQKVGGATRSWTRVKLRGIELGDGRRGDEAYLEELIALHPELLGFGTDDDDSRVRGPFVPFRQRSLTAFNGRSIAPDLVVLCGSGDVLVVEVKLGDNAELRDRQVVAQVLEYSACLGAMTEHELLRMFAGPANASSFATWTDFVAHTFPQEDSVRLVRQLNASFRSRGLHLIIACDDVPNGLRELVEGVVGQQSLGNYEFRVVELSPFLVEDTSSLVFVPTIKVQTEIVSRTAVTVVVTGQAEVASVQVQSTPFAVAEAASVEAKQRAAAKAWDETSFFDALAELPDATRKALRSAYDHFRSRGYDVAYGRGAKLGTVRVRSGGCEVVQLDTDGSFWIMFNDVEEATARALRDRIVQSGVEIPPGQYRAIKPASWVPRLATILGALDACCVELPELRRG